MTRLAVRFCLRALTLILFLFGSLFDRKDVGRFVIEFVLFAT
jgi:hypothetical protein